MAIWQQLLDHLLAQLVDAGDGGDQPRHVGVAQAVRDRLAAAQKRGRVCVEIKVQIAALDLHQESFVIGRIDAGIQGDRRRRPVHRTGIKELQPQPMGERPGHGGLARPRRAVDRDDQSLGHHPAPSTSQSARRNTIMLARPGVALVHLHRHGSVERNERVILPRRRHRIPRARLPTLPVQAGPRRPRARLERSGRPRTLAGLWPA